MIVMALDCEFNQPSKKTIQIGAACYDVKSGRLIDRLQTFVNPGEPISQHITELTGIRDQDVSNAPNIAEAYEMLRVFHAKNRAKMNPIIWGSGASNDSSHIYLESGTTAPNFMGHRILDAKSIYQSVKMFRDESVGGGLEDACMRLKIGFEGQKHTALADAMNTFRVWHFLVSRFGDLK